MSWSSEDQRRLASERAHPARRVRDLRGLLGAAADEAGLRAVSRGLTLVVDLDPALRGPWRLDEVSTRQALSAFTDLALSGHDGAASLEARLGEAGLELWVRTAAPAGLTSDEAVRATAAMVRRMGGRLDVEARDAKLAWRLSAPLVRPVPRLLLVQNDIVQRIETAGMAMTLGWACSTASPVEAEARLARGEGFDAVLVDLETAGAVGLARTTATYPLVPPMLALAHESASAWALRQIGFAAVARKPLTERRLAAALASVDAAEFVGVQGGDRGDEDEYDQNGEHGGSSRMTRRL